MPSVSLFPALRRATGWLQASWLKLVDLGLHADVPAWERKRIRLVNGITLVSLVVYAVYAVSFIGSADRVTFLASLTAFSISCGSLVLNYYRHPTAAAYYLLLQNTLYYCLIPIAKKNDGSEYILITIGIISVLLFQRLRPIVGVFSLNVAAFFAVRYAQKVIKPFWYQPESADVHEVNLFLFIITLFIVVCIFRRENARQEALLLHKNEQVLHSLNELHAAQAQLLQKEKMAALGELTASIAHEMQNPLNFVNNYAELSVELAAEIGAALPASSGNATARAATLEANLRKILHHGQRATTVVKGMLAHSRLGVGEKQPVNLNRLADEYLRLAYQGFKTQHKDFQAQLITSYDEPTGCLLGIPQELGRVLLNLYSNAFYAVLEKSRVSPAGYQPEIRVTTRYSAQSTVLLVRDNGLGIAAAILDKIYQPFFTTKPAGQGTGLGLSLSYSIVTKDHGGSLSVKTTPGDFTEFTLLLPLALPT
jgi:signal transduction histidine kinase